MPLQLKNGKSNPGFHEDAWLEVPGIIENGFFTPQYVQPLPDWLFNQTASIIHQRKLLIDWLAGKDKDGLTKALFEWPGDVPVKPIVDLAKELPKVVR